MIRLLLELGINYDAQDIEGNSPLDLAMHQARISGGNNEHVVKVIMWYKKSDERKAKEQEEITVKHLEKVDQDQTLH